MENFDEFSHLNKLKHIYMYVLILIIYELFYPQNHVRIRSLFPDPF